MKGMQFVLDKDGNAVECDDLITWAQWMETAERHVADDKIGGVRVSTIFMGLNHAFGDGPPVLWETMIFGGRHDGYTDRYMTREEAVKGHAAAVNLVNLED